MNGLVGEHIVELAIGDIVIDTWKSIRVEHDLLSPADSFDLSFDVPSWDPRMEPVPIVQRLREMAKRRQRVQLHIDGALQLTGYMDRVQGSEDNSGPSVRVVGRDVGGQVVDASMPLGFNIVGLTLEEVLTEVLSKWSIPVVIGNAGNRKLLTLKKKAYTLSSEQATGSDIKKFKWYKNVENVEITNYEATEETGAGLAYSDTYLTYYTAAVKQRKLASELKVEPEDTRWDWIKRLLKTQNLMGWFSADGSFVVASPNYDQDPLFHVTNAVETPGVPRLRDRTPDMNNVESGDMAENPGQRYSAVYVMARQGKNAIRGEAHDTELEALGVDRPLYHVDDEVHDIEEANRLALRLLQESWIKGCTYDYKLTGFGQGDRLFAFDTVFDVHDDSPARYVHELLYCTSLTQRYDSDTGPTTDIRLQPKGVIEVPS